MSTTPAPLFEMPGEIDISQEHRIGRDWVKSLALIGISIAVIVAFAYIMQNEASGYYEQRAKTASYVIVPLMIPFTLWIVFRIFVPVGPLVVIGPGGIADRRVNAALIPWHEISKVAQRGEFTSLTLKPEFLKGYSYSLGPRQMLIAPRCAAEQSIALSDLIPAYDAAYLKPA